MKASGSVSSLLQGVSQQPPENRGEGQHTEQINFLPDPVHGLARRPGTVWQGELDSGMSPSAIAALTSDTNAWRTFVYANAQHDYTVLYRAGARPGGSSLAPVQVYDQTTKTFLPTVRAVTDADLDLLASGGVSAITAIGKYVFMAGFSTPTTATTTELWNTTGNQDKSVVWIRGGAYNQTFSVTATKTDNTVVTFHYKTPTSSYQGTLDTSGVPLYTADPAGGTDTDTETAYIISDGAGHGKADLNWGAWAPASMTVKNGGTTLTNVYPSTSPTSGQYSWGGTMTYVLFNSALIGDNNTSITYTHTKVITNPNYSKVVNDITNAYNSAVTAWIASAAEATAPEAIAASLKDAAVAAGLTAAYTTSSTIVLEGIKALSVDDGGDGSLIRGVANTVTASDELSKIHLVGKVVKVQASGSAEAYYMKAIAKDGHSTGYVNVTWVEGSGTQYAINQSLIYLTVSGGTAYIGSSASIMNTLVPGLDAPDYVASTVGDKDTSPLPYFVGKQITYLGVFQDRLVVGAGAVIRCSKIGDYLNFFRSSVLTVLDDDPLETLAQNSDDDVLRYSVIYDRDLVVFGDKRQYVISGTAPLTPTSANMAIMANYPEAAQLPPLAVGGVVFYGQVGEAGSSVYQIQPGIVANTPESYLQSAQVDTYLSGTIIEFMDHAKPKHLLVRTTGDRHSLICFTYLDNPRGRQQAAWHRLSWHADLGPIVGISRTPTGLLLYFLRVAGTKVYWVAESLSLTTSLSARPYLDSLRPLAQVTAGGGSVTTSTTGDWNVAFDQTSEWRLLGDSLSGYAALLAEFPDATGPWVGISQATNFTPTNPFVKDKNGVPITNGKLTIASQRVSIANSSGFVLDLSSQGRQTSTELEYNARVIGDPNNVVGREVITDMTQQVPVALGNDDYTFAIRARTWLPLTITTLEWVGQWFYRPQRI